MCNDFKLPSGRQLVKKNETRKNLIRIGNLEREREREREREIKQAELKVSKDQDIGRLVSVHVKYCET